MLVSTRELLITIVVVSKRHGGCADGGRGCGYCVPRFATFAMGWFSADACIPMRAEVALGGKISRYVCSDSERLVKVGKGVDVVRG